MKLPAFMFYTGDWMKDPALRSCSLAARGLWMDLLCLMHESDRRGYLQHTTGKPVSHEQAARMTGCSPDQVSQLLQELEDSGVYSRTKNGTIYSRRMVADEKKRAACSEAGKKGGNPTLKGGDKGGPKGPPKPNQTPSYSSSDSSSSASSAAVSKTPSPSPEAEQAGAHPENGADHPPPMLRSSEQRTLCSLLLAAGLGLTANEAAGIAQEPRATLTKGMWALERLKDQQGKAASGRGDPVRNPAGYVRGLVQGEQGPPAAWVKANARKVLALAGAKGAVAVMSGQAAGGTA